MTALLKKFKPPEFDSSDQQTGKIIFYICLAILPALLVRFLLGADLHVYAMLATQFAIIVWVIWLLYHHKVKMAGSALLFSFLALIVALLLVGEGIHDSAVFIMPGLIMVAVLIVNRVAYVLFVVLCIASLFVVVRLELEGVITTPFAGEMTYRYLADVVVIILATSIGVGMLGENLKNTIRDLEMQHSDIERATDELESHTASLRSATARWQNLIENVTDFIFLLDREGIIEFTNHRPLSHYQKGVSTIYNYIVPDERAALEQDFNLAAESGKYFEREVMTTLKGEDTWFELRADVLQVGEDKKLMVVARDISSGRLVEQERATLAEHLRQASQMEKLGILAGGIAHDFNNSLSIIIAHTRFLDDEFSAHKEISERIKAIQDASYRGANLIRQILTFARKTDAEPHPTDVNELIETLAKIMRETMPKTVEISLKLAQERIPPILIDPVQLNQALLNICINARDAIGGRGVISIMTMSTRGDTIERRFPEAVGKLYTTISVTDSGPGMDATTISRVFEPFFTTKPRDRNTGLGLALVYGVVKAHHGLIDIRSQTGAGTTLTLHFPVSSEQSEQERELDTLDQYEVARASILVIEDDNSLRELNCSALTEFGYEVLDAENGLDGLELFVEHRETIDLVFYRSRFARHEWY